MATQVREYSWIDLVVRSNPSHTIESEYVTEYQFDGPSGGEDDRTHEGHRRVFKGHYKRRSVYAPETVHVNGLTWHGIPLDWNGQPIIWSEG
jgi:hypothetical protein